LPKFKPGSAELLLPLLTMSLVPLLVLYLLLRQRLAAFYLLSVGLTTRTVVMTLGILFTSSVISGAAAVVHGRYELISVPKLWNGASGFMWRPILEAYLLGIVALIGSSTLFMTAVKDAGGLPGLPSAEFVKEISSLRTALAGIQGHAVWREPQSAS